MFDKLHSLTLRALARKSALVLAFHSVRDEEDHEITDAGTSKFTAILDYVCSTFNVIPLADCVSRVRSGGRLGGAVCLTFDDGYSDWGDVIAPILKARGLHATFFVTTCQLHGQALWTERVDRIVRAVGTGNLLVNHRAFGSLALGERQSRSEASAKLANFLKYLRADYRAARLDELEQSLGLPPLPDVGFGAAQVAQLAALGFGIGAHTVTHPILNYCTAAEARQEISQSRQELEEVISKRVELFAYPNGRPGSDFSGRDVELVREIGFDGAVTTAPGSIRAGTSPYLIPRFSCWGKPALIKRQLYSNLLTREPHLSAKRPCATDPVREFPVSVRLARSTLSKQRARA